MRIAMIYGAFCLGRPLDIGNLYDSDRGLTGSELSFFEYAQRLADRHEVTLFLPPSRCVGWASGFQLARVTAIEKAAEAGHFDAAISWNEPDALRNINASLKVCNQQLNDFGYAREGYEDVVDIFTSPSAHHRAHMQKTAKHPEKWRVLPNGCSPRPRSFCAKVPGRVIYASSPDRGLHLLLGAWSKIRKAVPSAHLKIFYDLDHWLQHARTVPDKDEISPGLREMGRRARYIEFAMKRLAHLGVECVGSVSRHDIEREMAHAEVLAYPCDTVLYTEGFSVTTMEACGSWTLPCIAGADALGDIYGGHVPTVPAPASDHMAEFVENVVRGLTDPWWAEAWTEKANDLALEHSWEALTPRLEQILTGSTP